MLDNNSSSSFSIFWYFGEFCRERPIWGRLGCSWQASDLSMQPPNRFCRQVNVLRKYLPYFGILFPSTSTRQVTLYSCSETKFNPRLHIAPHLSCGGIWNYSTWEEFSDFSSSVMHRNLKFLHMTIVLIGDKCQVWLITFHFSISEKVDSSNFNTFLKLNLWIYINS